MGGRGGGTVGGGADWVRDTGDGRRAAAVVVLELFTRRVG